MSRIIFFGLISGLMLLSANSVSATGPLAPSGLMCDLLEHTERVWLNGYPSNVQLHELDKAIEPFQTAIIYSRNPAFSWILNDSRSDIKQTGFQILVGTDRGRLEKDEANLWDSGKIESDASIAVRYAGKNLPLKTVVYWKMKTWNNGTESPFSAIKAFLTADELLDYRTTCYPLQKTEQAPKFVYRKDRRVFVDFGKAAFGQIRLTLSSEHDDHTVTVHFGEAVIGDPGSSEARINRRPGGTIRYAAYQLRLMKGTHTYAVKFRPDGRNTGPAAIKMPSYIGEVYPFRYVEIENTPGENPFEGDQGSAKLSSATAPFLPQNRITREMVHYPFEDSAAEFSSGNKILNEVWEMCKYSIKATSYAGVYVDGDRERIPYEADALINQLCHYGADREFSLARHSHEYLIRHATWPTEWILQSVLMAYIDYMYTGDSRSIEAFYTDLEAKLLLPLADTETGLISTKTGKQNAELMKAIHYNGQEIRDIVDWPHTGILGLGKNEGGEADGFVFTDYNTVVNAYHFEALRCMAIMAESLGKTEDAKKYAEHARKIMLNFDRLFYDEANGRYRDGIGTDHAALHSSMFPVAFGMTAEKNKEALMKYIRSRGMGCSVYGSQFLMDAIYISDDSEYGLELLASESERSWYNMIRAGSTISMEAWDNKYKPNQDWNHAWGAVPGNTIPRKLIGIEPLEPGFKKIRIRPQLAALEKIDAKFPSIRGPIVFRAENRDSFELEIPANMTAELVLDAEREGNPLKWAINDLPINAVSDGKHYRTEIGSGLKRIQVVK